MKSFGIFFVIILCVFGCQKRTTLPTSPKAKLTSPAVVIGKNEVDLWNAYEENIAAADLQYTNRTVEFLLRDGRVAKDGADKYFIAGHVTDNPSKYGPDVICYIVEQDIPKLASIKRKRPEGTSFKVRGVCKGSKEMPLAWKGLQIILVDCHILNTLIWNGKDWVEDNKPQ